MIDGYLEYLDSPILNEKEIIANVNKILNESSVTKATLLKSHKHNIGLVRKVLSKYNVNVKAIEAKGKQVARMVSAGHKKGTDPQKVAKKIVTSFARSLIKKHTKEAEKTVTSGTADGVITGQTDDVSVNILKSIGILIVVIFVNSFLHAAMIPIVGPGMAMAVLAVVVAPIVEEYAKRVALLQDYPFLYNTIFAGTEALMYIFAMVAAGVPLPVAIIGRAITMCLHFFTLMIQKTFHDAGTEYSQTGYFIAVGVHAMWNLMAVSLSS